MAAYAAFSVATIARVSDAPPSAISNDTLLEEIFVTATRHSEEISKVPGIYLDDVPLRTRIVALSYWGNPLPLIFDVDRVEVDRGPQGTLFGAGAMGGAVRFVRPDPDLRQFSGFAHAEMAYTENGAPSYEAGIAAGGPIQTDVIGFRASALERRDGGCVDRVDPFTGALVDRQPDQQAPRSRKIPGYIDRGHLHGHNT
jgi:hypothetical protein